MCAISPELSRQNLLFCAYHRSAGPEDIQISHHSRRPLHRRVQVPAALFPSIAISQNLFADLFQFPRVIFKYLHAPLLAERSKYLLYLRRNGVPRTRLQSTASLQIHAIELLGLSEARLISAKQVQDAGAKWGMGSAQRKRTRPSNATCFIQTTVSWLTFIGLFVQPEAAKLPFASLVASYLEESRIRGHAEATIYNRNRLLSSFQIWLGSRHDYFAELSLNDIDDFMDSRRAKALRQRTLRHICEEIRLFVRYCESQNWCKAGIARGILTPRAAVMPSIASRGPAWKDVRRMLSIVATSPSEFRDNAIISLCAIYALRRSEIVQMRLDDLDWSNEIMTVRRAKRGGFQQFPIQHEVGEAILAYLRSTRPSSNCRSLFTTIRAPIRPMQANSIRVIVAKRMRMLGIKSQNLGPHALRHSCATQLLHRGFSLYEIADFLGHRGLHAVSVYAKYNPQLLRRVACFSLAEIR